MKPQLQAIKLILCSLTLGASVSAQAALNPPNDQMATINGGSSFIMGANDSDILDAPRHPVLVDTFQMDVNLITYDNWQLVYQWTLANPAYGYSFTTNASAFSGANQPVQKVSWYDALKWCNARSRRDGLTPCYYTDTADTGWSTEYTTGNINLITNNVRWDANGYRLPTEAEWEKAARGGLTTNRFPWGMTISQSQARYYSPVANSLAYDLGPASGNPTATSPVGLYQNPNGYGLNDMAGNLEEWCWDVYSSSYYYGNNSNPRGPATGSSRVIRGGEWDLYANICRCAARQSRSAGAAINIIGFRCVRAAVSSPALLAPVLQTPYTASSINFGQAISNSILSGGVFTETNGTSNLSGTSSFAAPNFTPTNAGPASVQVTFTPDDPSYGQYTANVNVVVNPTAPTVATLPTASTITTNQTLADSRLSGGVAQNPYSKVSVPGSFAFTTTSIQPPLGTTSESVTFAPSNTVNYLSVTTSVNVTVVTLTPTNVFVKVLPAAAINYGQALNASLQFSGQCTNASGTVVGGSFSISPGWSGLGTVPGAGTAYVPVIFTPSVFGYGTLATTGAVTVARTTPALTLHATTITYGQSLANSSLTNVANPSTAANPFNNNLTVAGRFAFSAPAIVPNAGTTNVYAMFIPADTTDYNSITNNSPANQVTMGVAQATPSLIVTVAGVKYGQSLSNSFLSASRATNSYSHVPVPGSFAFINLPPQPLSAGTSANIQVVFNPSNTVNYASATTTTSVVVARTTPALTPPGTNYAVINQALGLSAVSGGAANNSYNQANVPGQFSYTLASLVPARLGATNFGVTFTPYDGNDYTTNATTVKVVVIAAPTNPVPLLITANNANWDMAASPNAPPVFTVKCVGLNARDLYSGNTSSLVGTNTVFGTNLSVWTPAAYNALPNGTYTNFIIPALVGLTNYHNYVVSYGWGNLTITNNSVVAVEAAVVSNGVVASASLAGFLGNYNVDQAGLNAVLARYLNQSPPHFGDSSFPGGTNLSFTITNFAFSVQYNTNLSAPNGWHNLARPVRFVVDDTNAVTSPNRYYRLVGSTNY